MRLPGEDAKSTESWRTPPGVVYAVTYIATCHEESWARRQTVRHRTDASAIQM